jgi:cytochrome b561
MMRLIKRWAPAFIMMATIFGFSSIPSKEMPSFGGLDFSIKKFGHALGYALLALTYLRGLRAFGQKSHTVYEGENPSNSNAIASFVGNHPSFFAWMLALLFSGTDEFHQSFVPGRNPSLWDVFLFDNLGAVTGLWIYHLFGKRTKR